MQKQAAWAAASSSSGLVLPPGSSVREAHVTPASVNRPVVVAETVPLPLNRSPCQTALAVRSAMWRLLRCRWETTLFGGERPPCPRVAPAPGGSLADADVPTLRRLRAVCHGARPPPARQAAGRGAPGHAGHHRAGLRLAPPPGGQAVAGLRGGTGRLRGRHLPGM